MEEIEKFFRCPYCRQKISMLLDVSTSGIQTYIEDCEVCCRPIQVTFESNGEELLSFRREATQSETS
jgi:transcription elongation factor Elf1